MFHQVFYHKSNHEHVHLIIEKKGFANFKNLDESF